MWRIEKRAGLATGLFAVLANIQHVATCLHVLCLGGGPQ